MPCAITIDITVKFCEKYYAEQSVPSAFGARITVARSIRERLYDVQSAMQPAYAASSSGIAQSLRLEGSRIRLACKRAHKLASF